MVENRFMGIFNSRQKYLFFHPLNAILFLFTHELPTLILRDVLQYVFKLYKNAVDVDVTKNEF